MRPRTVRTACFVTCSILAASQASAAPKSDILFHVTPHAYYVVDVPGKANTVVLGLNDAGTLAGTFQDRPGHANHGFIATGALAARQ
jgi:hypothetical protein